jgi:hypothetical protein
LTRRGVILGGFFISVVATVTILANLTTSIADRCQHNTTNAAKQHTIMAKQYVIKTLGGNINARIGEALGGSLWKWEDGVAKDFTVKSVIRKGSVIARSGITTAPDIMDVTDIATGMDQKVLVGKVLLSTLTENYPNDGYVGKSFRVTQGPPPAGKRYKTMTVQPLELVEDGEGTEEPTPEAPEKKSKKK